MALSSGMSAVDMARAHALRRSMGLRNFRNSMRRRRLEAVPHRSQRSGQALCSGYMIATGSRLLGAISRSPHAASVRTFSRVSWRRRGENHTGLSKPATLRPVKTGDEIRHHNLEISSTPCAACLAGLCWRTTSPSTLRREYVIPRRSRPRDSKLGKWSMWSAMSPAGPVGRVSMYGYMFYSMSDAGAAMQSRLASNTFGTESSGSQPRRGAAKRFSKSRDASTRS